MQSFEVYYKERIAPFLPAWERKRQKLATAGQQRLKLVNILVTILTGIGSIYAWIYFDSFWVFFGAVFSVFVAMVLFQDQLKPLLLRNDGLPELQKVFKRELMPKVIAAVDPSWTYQAQGELSKEELLASHFFHFGYNTRIETDDLITGSWKGEELLIVNVKTTSVSESDPARVHGSSGQSFNGLLVRWKHKLAEEGEAFIIPKAKTIKAIGGLADMKFTRDHAMTVEEQKMHNLQAMSGSVGSYTWNLNLTPLKEQLSQHTYAGEGRKETYFYTSTDALYEHLSTNERLQTLLSTAFRQQSALEELAETGSFKLFDKQLMDEAVQTTLTWAIHSGYVWVLIPAFEDKFELHLDRPLDEGTITKLYNDLKLTLLGLSVF